MLFSIRFSAGVRDRSEHRDGAGLAGSLVANRAINFVLRRSVLPAAPSPPTPPPPHPHHHLVLVTSPFSLSPSGPHCPYVPSSREMMI